MNAVVLHHTLGGLYDIGVQALYGARDDRWALDVTDPNLFTMQKRTELTGNMPSIEVPRLSAY